jgi:cytochrome c553
MSRRYLKTLVFVAFLSWSMALVVVDSQAVRASSENPTTSLKRIRPYMTKCAPCHNRPTSRNSILQLEKALGEAVKTAPYSIRES